MKKEKDTETEKLIYYDFSLDQLVLPAQDKTRQDKTSGGFVIVTNNSLNDSKYHSLEPT